MEDDLDIEQAMHDAMTHRKQDQMLSLLEAYPEFFNRRLSDQDQGSWLHQAVLFDSNLLVAPLVQSGVDVNMQDAHGNTPLLLAALYDLPDIAESLLHQGANPMIKNKRGQVAMTAAISGGALGMLEIMLQKLKERDVAFDINALLHLSASNGYTESTKMLLEAGADPCAQREDGMCALDIARAREQTAHNYDANIELLEGWAHAVRAHRVIQSMSDEKLQPLSY